MSIVRGAALVAGLLVFGCGGDDAASGGGGASGGGTGGGSGGASGAAGAGTGGAGGADAGTGGAGPVIPFACPGGAITEGLNSGFLGSRSFEVSFPADRSKPLAVVFSWHGYGDSAANFHTALGLDPDADPSFPFVLVTPEDTGLFPPAGLDWDMFDATRADNADALLFEGILGCLAAQEDVDASRIYSIGFSAGAIMTNLLHARYPDLLAATLAYSGAWFADPTESSSVNTLGMAVNFAWPQLEAGHGGAVALTHGGVNDSFGMGTIKVIDFEVAAQAAVPFLTAAGRTVVECAHANGHQPHPEVGPGVAISFFRDHRAGEPSPYASGGLTGWPGSCTLHRP
ncbi:MAG: hypothetical protein IT376_00020 [Polyangiaceae bacterium]|nr:hypothetical protein [Polyangiaceae bacterium]